MKAKERIPAEMQDKYNEISEHIVGFCDEMLNDEYKDICLHALGKLCRKRPSPLKKGRANTWAAGIVYAVAANNFIFDKSMPIHMTARELVEPFGISQSTAGAKATEIRKMLKISYLNDEWMLQELIDKNPMNWMVSVDGMVIDARMLPAQAQRYCYEEGLMPYVYADKHGIVDTGFQSPEDEYEQLMRQMKDDDIKEAFDTFQEMMDNFEEWFPPEEDEDPEDYEMVKETFAHHKLMLELGEYDRETMYYLEWLIHEIDIDKHKDYSMAVATFLDALSEEYNYFWT